MLERSSKRLAIFPALLLGLALFAPTTASADWWDDDEGFYEEEDYGWGEDDSGWGNEYGEAGLGGDDPWWSDEDYGMTDYGEYGYDDYGYYDTGYDWDTDEEWFGDWW